MGKRHDGSSLPWPQRCRDCLSRDCEKGAAKTLSVCPYGYHYQHLSSGMIVAGVLVRNTPIVTPAQRKRFREAPRELIAKEMFERAVAAAQAVSSTHAADLEASKQAAVDEYIRTKQYEKDFLNQLKPEIQKGLAFVHDYKQINAQIIQNINVIIESKYKGLSFDEKLEAASPQEKAIYEASRFLEEKLAVAKFLLEPGWLDRSDDCVRCRFHGIVIKYVRIYTPRFKAKGIHLSVLGSSFAEVLADPQAIGVIPHTLIDNAAKYSPKNAKVEIYVEDRGADGIEFAVSSYGPRIHPDETDKIFQPFYRGRSAKAAEDEGAGYGLYISQLVAQRHLGTKVSVAQEATNTPRMGHWTTFSARIPLRAKVA